MRYLILIAVIIISACRFSSGRNNGDSAGNKYSLPDIPSFISDQSQRNSYLSEHFWDKFDFKDTSLVGKPATERFFAEYLNLVALSAGTSEKSLHNFMVRAMEQPLSREYYISLFEKYWGHPNSPYRNEEFYILFLESLLELEVCDSFQSDILQQKLDKRLKNRVGTAAANLNLLACQNGTLSEIELYDVESQYILLYFYNPGCEECMRYTYLLAGQLDLFLAENGVTVVSVYPDAEIDLWKEHQLPSHWVKSYDFLQQINGSELYYLQAIPTLYLLDNQKRVVLKDCTPEQLVGYF